ncbi:MAG: hypothetical protein II551_00115 [Paludibacteraceae bacterium]|nr:hypothetical protein [Paludibacteraceae bacterium]
MEQIVRKLNWIYYGQMVIAMIVLTTMYYMHMHGLYEPLDKMSGLGQAVQYIIIFDALVTIPLGLYLIKLFHPKTETMYFKCAAARILLVSNTLPLGIAAFYWMDCYRSMIWVAAIAAIAWYFSKPTIGKAEQEMAPKDPNEETY